MKNIAQISQLNLITKTLVNGLFLIAFALLTFNTSAQEVVQASDILQMVNKKEKVELEGVTIKGDLDFTSLNKKFRGGSYGVRKGVVKEYFTKLLAPLILKNCTIEGDIITFSENQTPGVLKENFVAFDEVAIFENCQFRGDVTFERMTFYQGIEIRNCTFEQKLNFDRVHFSIAPIIEGGNTMSQLSKRKTNWAEIRGEIPKKEERDRSNEVTIIFNNDTFKDVQIKFGFTTWNLNPLGKSSLLTDIGTDIYLFEDGKKQRVLLTASKENDGKEFKLSKL